MDLSEVKSLIEDQGKAWHDYRAENDKRLAAIEAKQSTSDYDAKLAKINTDLDALGKAIADADVARKAAGGAGGQSPDEAEHKSALMQYVRSGDAAAISAYQRKSLNSTTDSAAGYLILPEMDAMIDRVATTVSTFAGQCKTVPIGSRSYVKRAKTAGMSAAWPGEGATSGETTGLAWARIEIVANTMEVEPHVDAETLQDSDIDLAADLANEAGIAFGEGEGSALLTGNGVGKPRGLLSYTIVANASYAWNKVGYVASGASGAFAASNPSDALIELQHALRQQYRPGAVWMMGDTTLAGARQIKDGSGNFYLWQPDPAAGFGGVLLGSPVIVDDNMPVIAANSYSIAYGNMPRAYTRVVRAGTTLIRDDVTSKGVVKFNFRRRVGGGIVDFAAVKLMKFASS